MAMLSVFGCRTGLEQLVTNDAAVIVVVSDAGSSNRDAALSDAQPNDASMGGDSSIGSDAGARDGGSGMDSATCPGTRSATPSFVRSVASGDQSVWTNLDTLDASDDDAAQTSLTFFERESERLEATSFGLDIPPQATVTGISVAVRRRASFMGVIDSQVRLIRDGAPVGQNRALLAEWPNAFAEQTYGNPGDTWGLTWTREQIRAPGFGVGIRAVTDLGLGIDIAIDLVRVTVHYTCNN